MKKQVSVLQTNRFQPKPLGLLLSKRLIMKLFAFLLATVSVMTGAFAEDIYNYYKFTEEDYTIIVRKNIEKELSNGV